VTTYTVVLYRWNDDAAAAAADGGVGRKQMSQSLGPENCDIWDVTSYQFWKHYDCE